MRVRVFVGKAEARGIMTDGFPRTGFALVPANPHPEHHKCRSEAAIGVRRRKSLAPSRGILFRGRVFGANMAQTDFPLMSKAPACTSTTRILSSISPCRVIILREEPLPAYAWPTENSLSFLFEEKCYRASASTGSTKNDFFEIGGLHDSLPCLHTRRSKAATPALSIRRSAIAIIAE